MSIAEFERDQSEQDAIGSTAADVDVVPDSTRLVGEAGQYTVYLAKSSDDERTLCIVAFVTDTDEWESTGCGGDGMRLVLRDGTGIEVDTFDGVGETGRTRLSESVFMVPATD